MSLSVAWAQRKGAASELALGGWYWPDLQAVSCRQHPARGDEVAGTEIVAPVQCGRCR